MTAEGFELVEGNVLPQHQITVYTNGSQIWAGSSLNRLVCVVYSYSENISNCYEIEVDEGTLTVTPRNLTLLSGSAEKLYDGTSLICHEFSVIDGTLVNGDQVNLIDFTGEQKEVGSSNNTFRVGISSTAYFGETVTSSYRIQYQYGTLTVHPNPNYTPPEDNEENGDENEDDENDSESGNEGQENNSSIYDSSIFSPDRGTGINFPGNTTSNKRYATVYTDSQEYTGQLIYFRAGSYGDYWGRGWMAATPYETQDTSPLEFVGRAVYDGQQAKSMKIKLVSGCPILFPYYSNALTGVGNADIKNDCYFVKDSARAFQYTLNHTEDFGYYSTISHPLSAEDAALEENYRSFVYANYLNVPDSTHQALLTWANNQGIYQSSSSLVQDIQEAVRNAGVYAPHAEDAYSGHVDDAVHFLTVAKAGICQHFASAATLLYRCFGIPARYTVGFLPVVDGAETAITGADAHAWVEIYQPGLGWIPIEVTSSIQADAPQYNLSIQAASATKYYDGTTFVPQLLNQYILTSGELMPGHRLEVYCGNIENYTEPGIYENEIQSFRILDQSGIDVTNYYGEIQLQSGVITILPRKITVVSGSATQIGFDNPLSCNSYWITQGSLAKGDTLVVTSTSDIDYTGSVPNSFAVQIVHTYSWGGETDVTGCYEIAIIPGTLTILPDTP